MIKNTSLLIMITVTLTLSACVSSRENVPSSTDSIVFPRQEELEGERAVMEAEIYGTLVLNDDCIRIKSSESDTSYLLIWPPSFKLVSENNVITILNRDGEGVVKVGDRVRLSGGEVKSQSMLDVYVQEQMQTKCPGPYWVIGDEIDTIESSK